jgi:WD40 repeat protein
MENYMKMLKKIMLLALMSASACSTIFGMAGFVWETTRATSKDGKLLARGFSDSTIKLLNTTTHKVDFLFCPCEISYEDYKSIKAPPRKIAFSPNGKYLAVGLDDRTIHIYDLQKQQWIDGYREFKDDGFALIEFNENGTQIIVYTGMYVEDSKIVAYDVPQPREEEKEEYEPREKEKISPEVIEWPTEFRIALLAGDIKAAIACIDALESQQKKVRLLKSVSPSLERELRAAVDAKRIDIAEMLVEYYAQLGVEISQDCLPWLKELEELRHS